MDTIDTLIPDNKGNHLVVVLYFYDDADKTSSLNIPSEYIDIEIADINIRKVDLDKPLDIVAFFEMCRWLIKQFLIYPNAVFSFICSTDSLDTNHVALTPEKYRWSLFEHLFLRNKQKLSDLKIKSNNIIIGPEGYQTYAKVFYRDRHAPVIHLIESHLKEKYY